MPDHPYNTLYGSVLDERNDAIDFSTGEPVHTHGGAAIDLSSGCPAVYKYAYLMDEQSPVFGRQASRNALAWQVATNITPLDATATAYRVRGSDGSVLLDWTSIAADTHGVFTIELHRNGAHSVPALGTKTGQMHLEVRFRDTSGSETLVSACWEHHPLAVPLDVEQLGNADLFQWTLPAGSPISKILNGAAPNLNLGWGADALSQRLIQYTGEPVTFTLGIPQPTGSTTKTVSDTYLAAQTTTTPLPCANLFAGPCAQHAVPAAVHTTSTAPFAPATQWEPRVIDEATGTVLCHADWSLSSTTGHDIVACTLPARGAAEGPHAYRLVLSMSYSVGLMPPFFNGLGNFGDYTLGSSKFTGNPPLADGLVTCTNPNNTGLGTPFYCYSTLHYSHVVALEKARIDFDPYSIQLTTSPGATSTFLAPPNIATSKLGIGAQTWDAGDDGI